MYRLRKFRGQQLPTRMLEENYGSGDAASSYVNATDRGAFDNDGTSRSPRAALTITRRCIISQLTAELAHEEFRTWMALVGVRGQLEREALPTGDLHWIWARLDAVNADHDSRQFNRTYIPIEFRWSVQPPVVWRGSAAAGAHHWDGAGQFNVSKWRFNDATGAVSLANNPQSLTVVNQGNVPVDNAIVKLTAGTLDMSAISLWCSSGASWHFRGTVVGGNTLEVDCGARRVRNNGVNAWSDFWLDPAHRGRSWLRLVPGNNTILVTVGEIAPGAESVEGQVLIEFYHGWA